MSNVLQDQVALVSGASRGIGAAIADMLASNGARVFGTATSENGATAISGRGVEGLSGLALDVNDANGIASTLGEITRQASARYPRPSTARRSPSSAAAAPAW